jgi:MoxR-like ATPase
VTVQELAERCDRVLEEVERAVVGKRDALELVLLGLLADGHVLIEDFPGLAKTLIARAFAQVTSIGFTRIQFTPDLMPSDVTGSSIFNQRDADFEFRPGPIFTNLLLADEINRTPPRTQAALLESMQENAATVDGTRYEISQVFTVFATQNPVEFEGTYPLPEAQRDRFLMKISIDFPEAADEARMLESYAAGLRLHDDMVGALQPVITAQELFEARRTVARSVRVEPQIIKYIQELVSKTRNDEAVQIGAGPRASLALLESSRAAAALQGRDFITPDDVKSLVAPVLAHRVTLSPEAEMEGMALEDLLARIFDAVEVPR